MKIFCWIFMLSIAIVSPLFLDLYPFSVFPMFSDNACEHLFVEVVDADDQPVPAISYGLHKFQIANRQQRYGLSFGPNYFEEHDSIEPDKVRAFLNRHYSECQYPIRIRYWSRGFDQRVGKVGNLSEPCEITIDLVAERQADLTEDSNEAIR